MEIKVYANCDAEVITEKGFLAKIEELAKEYDEDVIELEIFLEENYSTIELWDITESEKAKAIKTFHEINIEKATNELGYRWFATILEV